MKVVWGKDLEDLVNLAQNQGWMLYLNRGGKHYYYVYVGNAYRAHMFRGRSEGTARGEIHIDRR